MSSRLVWEPLDKDRKSLPDALKFALHKRYGVPLNETLSDSDNPYLQGLLHGGVEGVAELLDAIERWGAVVITEVY